MAHGRSASRLPYFYPRPPRGGRLAVPGVGADPLRISIHALREEGDFAFSTISTMSSYFYPRPPRGGRRKAIPCWQSRSRFLSTPSARRATRRSWQGVQLRSISIHALREEGDDKHALVIKLLKIFLSTPSARRATRREVALNVRKKISIHALREEGDNNFINHCTAPFNFYPRPPRGGRHRSWHR